MFETEDLYLPNSRQALSSLSEAVMNPASPPCLNRSDWKTLYRIAIQESDRSIRTQRIAEAEKAVITRRREIFYADGSPEEKEALEDALYALHAFQTACQQTDSGQSRSSGRGAQ